MQAWRRLRRRPGLAAAAVVMLAMGIGAATAMFSLAASAWLRPLPYPNASRLVNIWLRNPRHPRLDLGVGTEGLREVQKAPALANVVAYMPGAAVWRVAGQRRQFGTALVGPGLFRLLGAHAGRGRLPANGAEALIGPRLAAVLGGPGRALGQTIEAAGRAITVVGVAPAGFHFPALLAPGRPIATEIWLPLTAANDGILRGSSFSQPEALGLRRRGLSPAALTAQLAAISPRLPADARPGPGWRLQASSLVAETVGAQRGPLALLWAATILVLLIAVINAAQLLLERAWATSGEISLHMALGASPAAIRRMALSDSLLLALAGGGLGLGLAYAISAAVRRWAPVGWLPTAIEPRGAIVIFAFVGALAAGLAAGWLPARMMLRRDPALALRAAGGTVGGGTGRARPVLVIGEVALAVVLAASSILLVRGFARLAAAPTGMNTDRVLSVYFAPSRQAYPTPSGRAAFWRRLLHRVQALPGVSGAAITGAPILARMSFVEPPLQTGRVQISDYQHRGITPGYFRLLHIPLLRGRDFGPGDRRGATPVVIVNQALAREGWPGSNPVGRQVRFVAGRRTYAFQVAGVAADTRDNRLRSAPAPEIYTPLDQLLPAAMSTNLLVRTEGPPGRLKPEIQNAVWSVAGDVPISFFRPLSAVISQVQAAPRFVAAVVAGFAALGLILAGIGVYGLFAHAVTRRRREIGIRLALGAAPRQVAGEIWAQGARLLAAGVGLGLAGAWLAGRLLRGLLYGVSPADPWALAGAAALLTLAGLAAGAVPLRRAWRTDPAQTLREE